MKSLTTKQYLLLAAAGAAFVVVFFLSNFVQANRVHLPVEYEDADLSLQGKRLKGWSLGSDGLLADWYWINSLQYIGGKIVRSTDETINLEDLTSLNPRLLYPMLDNATDLDPKFMAAYSYGAIVLPAVDPNQAIALTEKGIADNPQSWRLYQYLGYIYWRQKDFQKAAETYAKGAAIPGAAPFMKEMSAAMLTQGGSRETARAVYSSIAANAEDQQSRESSQLRLKQLDALDDLDAINETMATVKDRTGKCPAKTADVAPLLRSVKLPHNRDFLVDRSGELADPTGIPYVIDAGQCKAMINLTSKVPRP